MKISNNKKFNFEHFLMPSDERNWNPFQASLNNPLQLLSPFNNPIFTKCITFAPLLTLAPLLKRWLLHCRAPFTTTRRPATSFVREQTTSQTCSFRSQILSPFMEILGLQSTLYIYINNFSGQFIYSDLYNRCVQFCMIIAPYIVLFLCNVTKCKEKKISTQMIFLDSSTTRWSTSSQLKISQFTLSPSQHGR